MWRNLILVFLGVALIGIAVPARADNTQGLCNSLVADGIGPALQFVNGVGDPIEHCVAVGVALEVFLATPGCFELFVAGEIRGLAGPASTSPAGPKAGEAKFLGDVICSALFGCGFGPFLPPEICPDFDG